MGEEDDAHGPAVKRAGADQEESRLAAVHAAYAADAARRRRWDLANPGNSAIRGELARAVLGLSAARGPVAARFLDVGCGTGWWLERLAAEGVPGERLFGVDLLADRVRAAAGRVPGAQVIRADARDLPLPDATADVITLFTVLSLMPGREERAAALAEVARVAAPGALVAVWEPRLPTPNRHTELVAVGEVRAGLAGELSVRSITVLPPVARRAGRLYGMLARVPLLRSHRLIVVRVAPA